MTPDDPHPTEELQELVDERLTGAQRVTVERHLDSCSRCRSEAAAYASLRATLKRAAAPVIVPADLRSSVLRVLDDADAGVQPSRHRRGRMWKAVAFVAAASVVLALLVWPRFSDISTIAAANAHRLQQGAALHLDVETDQVEVLGAYFERNHVAARVIDLGMFGYQLVGGGIHRLGGHRSAFFVYRGPGGRLLFCEMYEGTEGELPEGAEVRRIGRFTFFVYGHLGQTVVFWKERQSMCILVSDAPKEEVIKLAAAKAM